MTDQLAHKSMASSNVALMLVSDEAYALPTCVAVFSATREAPSDRLIDVLVVDGGLSAESRRQIERCSNGRSVWFITTDDFDFTRVARSPLAEVARIPPLMFAYFPAIDLVTDQYDPILYLDSDTLTVTSLEDLLTLDLGISAVAGAVDAFNPTLDCIPEVAAYSYAQGLDPQLPYLNSGVILVNTRVWRSLDVSQRALSIARTSTSLMYPDQDCLNLAVGESRRQVGLEWNFMASAELARRYIGPLPKIVHYAGPRKPWRHECRVPLLQAAYTHVLEEVRILLKEDS